MEVGKVVTGLAIVFTVILTLAAWLPTLMRQPYGDEDLFIRDVCTCAARPMNATRMYFFTDEVVVSSGRLETERLVAPLCANLTATEPRIAYQVPVRTDGEMRLRGLVQLVLFSTGNGTCVVRQVAAED